MSAVGETALLTATILIEEGLDYAPEGEIPLTDKEQLTDKVMQKALTQLKENGEKPLENKTLKSPLKVPFFTPAKGEHKKAFLKAAPTPIKSSSLPSWASKNSHASLKQKALEKCQEIGNKLMQKSAKKNSSSFTKSSSFLPRSMPRVAAKPLPSPWQPQAPTPKRAQNKGLPQTPEKTPRKTNAKKNNARQETRKKETKNARSALSREVEAKKEKLMALLAERDAVRDQEKEHQREKEEEKIEGIENKKSGQQRALPFPKPILERPKLGLFPLYYLLDKLGLAAEAHQYQFAKSEIADVDEKMKLFFEKKIEAIKKAIEEDKSRSRWGILQQVISWIASAISIILGVTLILSGGGAVAGVLLIAGGLFTLTSQILQITGAWNKIGELLPGDDPEKKRAVITWIQIGIAVLSLILGGIGIVAGGFSAVSESMSNIMRLIGAVAAIAGGVSAIGVGVSEYLFKNKLADVKEWEVKLTILRHRREDLLDLLESGLDRLRKLYEMLCDNLELEEEVYLSHQLAWR